MKLFSRPREFPRELAAKVDRQDAWRRSAFGRRCQLSLSRKEFSDMLDQGHSLLLYSEKKLALTLRGELQYRTVAINLDLFDLPGKAFVGLFDFKLPPRGPALTNGQLFLPDAAFSQEAIGYLQAAGFSGRELDSAKFAESRWQTTSAGFWLKEGCRRKESNDLKPLSHLLLSTGIWLASGLGRGRVELQMCNNEKIKIYLRETFAAEPLYPDRGMVIRT